MKPAVQRVAAALAAGGVKVEIVELAESTRTAEEAAAAVGTTVGRIVKSLVFIAGEEPVLALVSGANRLDTARLSAHLDRPVRRASADEVRSTTGFAIGGVPPLGHARDMTVFIDRDLLSYDLVYAAAGTPYAVFPLAPVDLARLTGGTVLELALESGEAWSSF